MGTLSATPRGWRALIANLFGSTTEEGNARDRQLDAIRSRQDDIERRLQELRAADVRSRAASGWGQRAVTRDDA